jgi:hypothetical protein
MMLVKSHESARLFHENDGEARPCHVHGDLFRERRATRDLASFCDNVLHRGFHAARGDMFVTLSRAVTSTRYVDAIAIQAILDKGSNGRIKTKTDGVHFCDRGARRAHGAMSGINTRRAIFSATHRAFYRNTLFLYRVFRPVQPSHCGISAESLQHS